MHYIIKDLRSTKQLGTDVWYKDSFGQITDNIKDAGIYTEDDKDTIWRKSENTSSRNKSVRNLIEYVELTPEIISQMKAKIQEYADAEKQKLDKLLDLM